MESASLGNDASGSWISNFSTVPAAAHLAVVCVQREVQFTIREFPAVTNLTRRDTACVTSLGLSPHVALTGRMRTLYACPEAIVSLASGTSCQSSFYSGLFVTQKSPRGCHTTSAFLNADHRRISAIFLIFVPRRADRSPSRLEGRACRHSGTPLSHKMKRGGCSGTCSSSFWRAQLLTFDAHTRRQDIPETSSYCPLACSINSSAVGWAPPPAAVR